MLYLYFVAVIIFRYKRSFMIGIEIRIEVGTEKRKEFLQSFDMFSRIRNERNQCLERTLLENVTVPNRFLWVEHWDSEDALVEYMNSDRFNALMGVVDALGRLEDLKVVDYVSAEDWPR